MQVSHNVVLSVLFLGVLQGCSKPIPRPTISLHEAARTGNLAQIESHLHYGCDVNALEIVAWQDQSGSIRSSKRATPLHAAVYGDQRDAIVLLMKNGANPAATSEFVSEPGEIRDPILKELTRATPLSEAVFLDRVNALRALVESGADVNASGNRLITPLAMARNMHRDQIASYLQNHGAHE